MKNTTLPMALHLMSPLTSLADCCRVQWVNGTILAFTTHDEPLVVEADTYLSSPGMQRVAVQSSAGLAVDNTEIVGVLDDDVITDADIEAGLWDGADVRFFQVNWQDLSMGQLKLRRGGVGEIHVGRNGYTAEIRGLLQLLVREIGDLYAPDCQADLGDARCKVDLAPLTVTGTVTFTLGDNRIFGDSGRTEGNGWFSDGVVTWLTGANAGRRMEVEYWDGDLKNFALFLPMHGTVANGDTYSVYPGCDKRITTCEERFNNVDNNRSYPFVPGIDQLLLYPDSHT